MKKAQLFQRSPSFFFPLVEVEAKSLEHFELKREIRIEWKRQIFE